MPFEHNIFLTQRNIFVIISLPFLLHEKCPDFFLLTQRQQAAHPSVYDDVVPGDYSDSSCGIFPKKKHFSLFFYTSTIPEIPNSHISDDLLDSQTIILKQFLQNRASRILTPPKLCEQNSQRENTKELLQTPSQLCKQKFLLDVKLVTCPMKLK
jgi:hypothetical protein